MFDAFCRNTFSKDLSKPLVSEVVAEEGGSVTEYAEVLHAFLCKLNHGTGECAWEQEERVEFFNKWLCKEHYRWCCIAEKFADKAIDLEDVLVSLQEVLEIASTNPR